jgi:hypothetical protein
LIVSSQNRQLLIFPNCSSDVHNISPKQYGGAGLGVLFGFRLYNCFTNFFLNSSVFLFFLLPFALQPAVGFGLSNNTSPFFPI